MRTFANIKTIFNEHREALLLILAYFVLLAPFALQFTFYLPDEHHYGDAAIAMLQNGDYISPVNPNGGYRFLKPIFTYWTVVVSYVVFGINQFSSRLPFLIAGCLTLWMTYKNTLLAFNQKKTAILSMLMVGSSFVINRSVATILTDIWQLLFLQVLTYGVIGLLTQTERRKHFLWMIYIGTALAITVKGLVAVAFFIVCMAFLLLNPWKRSRLKDLIHIPAMLVATVISLFWYVAVYYQHGPDALFNFYNDQVGKRTFEQVKDLFTNFLYSLLTVIGLLLPFAVAAWRSVFLRKKDSAKFRFSAINPVIAFSVFWILSMVFMAIFLSKFYFRYFIPVSHLQALILSHYMIKHAEEKSQKTWLKATLLVLFVLFLLTNLTAVISTISLKYSLFYLLIIGLTTFAGAYYFISPNEKASLGTETKIFVFTLAIFSIVAIIGRQFGLPDSGTQITRALRENKVNPSANIVFFGDLSTASRVRIASEGDYYWKVSRPDTTLTQVDAIVSSDRNIVQIDTAKYQITQISEVWEKYPAAELLKFPDEKELKKLKDTNAEKYYLALPK